MKISSKTGLVLLIVFLGGGVYLLGMFYYAAGGLGEFAQAGRARSAVLGENVRRWRLPASETLLAFSAGQGDYKLDKLFITFENASKKRWLRVIREPDNLLIYEQELALPFDSALWRDASHSFLLEGSGGGSIELAAREQTYYLAGD